MLERETNPHGEPPPATASCAEAQSQNTIPAATLQSGTPPGSPPRRKRWRRRIIAAVLGCLLAAAVAELGLRLAGVHKGGIISMGDHWTGYRHIPNRTTVYDAEGFAVVRINSVGIRDHETTWEKPPGVFRIVLLGDSNIEAKQVDLDAAISEVLERLLNQHGRFEVLNCGVNGFSTTQEYFRLREFALRFDPDLVLLAIHTGNDVRDNHRGIEAGRRPYFTLKPDGTLELDDSFRRGSGWRAWLARESGTPWLGISWLTTHSRLAGLTVDVLRKTIGRQKPPPGDAEMGEYHVGASGDWRIYDPHPQGLWEEAWTVTEKVLLMIRDLCETRDLPLAVVVTTNSPQVNPKARQFFAERYPALDLDYPDRRIEEFCTRHGVNCLRLAPPLLEHCRASGEFVHGFGSRLGQGHWNETGHRLAAEHIERFLQQNHLLPLVLPDGQK